MATEQVGVKFSLFYVFDCNYLVLVRDRVLALFMFHLIMNLARGQTFQWLLEKLYRQTCLGVPAVASF